jgi:AraC family carnitine catabolism transcriptional activator
MTEVVGFFLVPNFSMMAFVSALEPLRVANRLAQQPLYRWEIISRDGGPVAASNQLALVADRALATPAPPPTKLVVAASFAPEAGYDRTTERWLRLLAGAGVDMGAIDTGSFFLAWAGLLNGYRATTHWESLASFTESFPTIDVGSGLFIIDRTRFTCAGGTAALDMMLHLIRLRHGQALAAAVSDQFIHAKIRDPEERQRLKPMADGAPRQGVALAIDLMESHLEDVLSIDSLCATAGISPRHLQRAFQRQFRLSPQRYYLDLRLQRARALLHYSELTVTEVALACGFVAASHFSRAYSAWAGRPPAAERAGRGQAVVPALR